MDNPPLKTTLEALLFVSHEPLPLAKFLHAFGGTLSQGEIRKALQQLKEEYDLSERAFQLDEIAGGWMLRTRPPFQPFVDKLYEGSDRRSGRLSLPSSEVLSIVAYRQPITRIAIETLRGVDCSGLLQSLMERELIEIVGRQESPGRPALYGTTKRFLQHFGLSSIDDLPPL